MLVDANLLLFAEDETSRHHAVANQWLSVALNGSVRVGLPWPCLLAFARIRTNPRVYSAPLSGPQAWARVRSWLRAPSAWVPQPTPAHAEVLGGLVERYQLSGNALPDAHLAALAIEYGVAVCSADTDFARFTEVRWVNPVRP